MPRSRPRDRRPDTTRRREYGDQRDVGAAQSRRRSRRDIDRRAGGEHQAKARAGDGDDQQGAGEQVIGATLPVEGQKRADPRSRGAEEADPGGPQQVLPGGAEEEQDARGQQRGPATDAPPDVDEDERRHQHQQAAVDEAERQRRLHPEGRQQDLVDEHRAEVDVFVVRFEEGVERPVLAVEDDAPLVVEEGQAIGQAENERDREGAGDSQERRLGRLAGLGASGGQGGDSIS